jgi:hypothetical protein
MDNQVVTSSYDNQVSLYFDKVMGSYNLREEEVKMEVREVIGVYSFKQQKAYEIPGDLPKINSINVHIKNNDIVTIVFEGEANLYSIKNILQLHSAKYKVEHRGGDYPFTTIKIEKNALNSLAHLKSIYSKLAVEAGSLIWEALLLVVANAMDKAGEEGSVSWKESISYQLDSWLESLSEGNGSRHFELSMLQLDEYYNYRAKTVYSALSDQEKYKFLEAIISEAVKQNAQQVIDYVEYERYRTVNDAFNTTEKCNSYVENNIPNAINSVREAQNITRVELKSQFGPTILDAFLDPDAVKDAKALNSEVKAAAALLGASKYVPFLGEAQNIVSLIIGGIYFYNKSSDKKLTIEEITEISDKFICMNFICSSEVIMELNEESKGVLRKFYSSFVYKVITKNEYGNKNISDYLLDKISDSKYIDDLWLRGESNVLLTNNKGEKFTIKSLIESQDKELCYNNLLKILSGEDVLVVSKSPQVLDIKAGAEEAPEEPVEEISVISESLNSSLQEILNEELITSENLNITECDTGYVAWYVEESQETVTSESSDIAECNTGYVAWYAGEGVEDSIL